MFSSLLPTVTPIMWVVLILAACVLDWIIGDPRWIPHPVVVIGNVISAMTKLLNRGKHLVFKGAVLWIFVMLFTASAVFLIEFFAGYINYYFYLFILLWFLASTLAQNSLREGVLRPLKELKKNNLKGARFYTGWLVGRQTDQLTEHDLLRAIVETTAENCIDGILAPMFYMILGLFTVQFNHVLNPLMFAMLYKAVNTMDSMIGYIYEPYTEFGRVAAKMDDFFNLIPARLGSLFMIAAGYLLGYDAGRGWEIFRRDRKNHKSPNSAHPESAVAGLLGISLGGNNVYFGHVMKKPTIGDSIFELCQKDIQDTLDITGLSQVLIMILLAVGSFAVYLVGRI